ncbi:ABC transporter permease [Amantichitinum ursilacus]|uniref:Ribose transport system permease protein RbsC n=1 Tax=Amantichitinum ursilacus TaxID=857265 RepID=A0A0N0GM89_9NEIS|nr:ABC transporter permease [Amantichitinum ursilacus]KPC50727.1 Ribose transport system permease protein RbsC [Amantichitinum ursilacus]
MTSQSATLPLAPSAVKSPRRSALERLRRYALFGVLALLIIGFSSAEPAFIQPANLLSILQGTSVDALLGLAVTVALIAGGFDLSIGATAATALIASSYAMVVWQWGALPTLVFGLFSGVLIGLFNALLVVRLRIPDLLATLATMFLLGGLQLIPTGGQSISSGLMLRDGSSATGVFAPAFLALGRARLLGIPVPVLVVGVLALVIWALMERTRWGRVFYATGGNEEAARLAGAPTTRYRTTAYVISGALAALGGLIIAARVGRGDVSGGSSLLLDSVGATLIGFAVLDARRPNVLGTLVGAIFVGVLLNGLTMLNVPFYTQDFVKGLVLVAALGLTFGLGRARR